MQRIIKLFILQLLGLLLFNGFLHCQALVRRYTFVVQNANYTRLCKTKSMLTVNGQFPGPTIYANRGDTVIVDVLNRGPQNITIHWHGVKQPRYPWSDGPEYITQCPIKTGANFSQKIVLSDEEGTLWWHAHSDWSRATVHGALIVYPQNGTNYPFPKPHQEVPIIFAEWWRADIQAVLEDFLYRGGDPNTSDAYLINGQPGHLYPCSGTFRLAVDYGKTYLLRMVNSVMNNILFFAIARHNVTIVGTDGSYVKPFSSNYIAISPGQTLDVLLEANQQPNHYYFAARPYNSDPRIAFDNTTTSAILEYHGNYTPSDPPIIPKLPFVNNTNASVDFTAQLRSLANRQYPIDVPLNITTNLFYTLSINSVPCPDNQTCEGPSGRKFAASVNNITWQSPNISVLQAYYEGTSGVYTPNFPSFPPFVFNFTASNLPAALQLPQNGTEVRVLEYNSTVELVLQGTSLVAGVDHPMHLHGYSFYVVGHGFGNFDANKSPQNYNLIDPPLQNTIAVPKNGWTAIRFKANNPGVWLMHCHFERHISWGMETTFIVKNGTGPDEQMLPPPPDVPPC